MRAAAVIFACIMLAACQHEVSSVNPADGTSLFTGETAQELRKELRIAEQSNNMSMAGGATILVGVLSFVLGHVIGIPRWVGAATVGLGVCVSAFGYQLIEFMGTDISKYIMAVSFGMLAIGFAAAAVWYMYDFVKDRV